MSSGKWRPFCLGLNVLIPQHWGGIGSHHWPAVSTPKGPVMGKTYPCHDLIMDKAIKPQLIARFMGPTWGPSGADRTQVGPMLAPWNLQYILLLLCLVLWWVHHRHPHPHHHHHHHHGFLWYIYPKQTPQQNTTKCPTCAQFSGRRCRHYISIKLPIFNAYTMTSTIHQFHDLWVARLSYIQLNLKITKSSINAILYEKICE